ncbi:MAG TPA: SDR family oxidoreductase [Methylomirabilota bacterium]|jgi:NAD(P)-dependent dehydrogenase (short-subunit alcohol dehydrogenase family)|nr:SDR family oxidoreductase [Methylomirabilota bacterium]
MRLTGKVVLITNVGQYMGLACAEEFAKEGAILALHERTETRAHAALELARAHGREATVVTGDLTVSGEANRVVRAVAERHGRLDVLINNSSHPPVGGPVDEVSDETWRSMTAHLYDEPFFCLRAAIRVMKRQGYGKVVNLTSAVAIPGLPNYAAYSAARAGTNGLTRAAGREVARHNIQVNAIAQNFVENPTYFGPEVTGSPEKLARVVRNVPAGRLARSEESAKLCVFLACDESDFFCGQVIPFAGGWI